jgi:hypothetical protein
MTRCPRCHAPLSDWELREARLLNVTPCWCQGIPAGVSRTLANVAYAELCHADLHQPVKTHDVVRFVSSTYLVDARFSMGAALSQGKRFCWGGRALYGLARHGPIPGPRTLAEAAYAVSLAAPQELYVEEIDFVLEQLNYRFNSDSLLHHLRGYTSNRWGLKFHTDIWGRVSVRSGREARHEFNRCVGICPTQKGFDHWISEILTPKVESSLSERARRIAVVNGTAVSIAGDRLEFH